VAVVDGGDQLKERSSCLHSMSDRIVILDPRVRLLHSIAGSFLEKGCVWVEIRQIIEPDPAVSFSDLCKRHSVKASAWYHALSAIPAGEVSLGTMGYIGILISAIDDELHIESSSSSDDDDSYTKK
jgi:hypothetical protein